MFGCAMDFSSVAPRSNSAAKPGRVAILSSISWTATKCWLPEIRGKLVLRFVDSAEPPAAEACAQAITPLGQADPAESRQSSATVDSDGSMGTSSDGMAWPWCMRQESGCVWVGSIIFLPCNMPLDTRAVPSFMLTLWAQIGRLSTSPFGDGAPVSVRPTGGPDYVSRGSARSGGTGPPGRPGRSASRAGRSRA